MLFPKEALDEICKGRNCPNRNANRTHGICIRKQQGDYFFVNSAAPTAIIIFRDPTIRDNRDVRYFLDIKCDNNKKVSSRLFDVYNKYLLKYFSEEEVVYLDNLYVFSYSVSTSTSTFGSC
jgi:hypothetical protein